MVDLTVRLSDSVVLANPVMVASGTFGYGDEVSHLMNPEALGGIVTKSVTPEYRPGHPAPRIAETHAGMLNAIGLANVGVERFCTEKLPFLNRFATQIFVGIAGATIDEYCQVLERVEAEDPRIAGYEVNISCPNVDAGGMEFGVDPLITEKLTRLLRSRTKRFLLVKLSPNVTHIAAIAQAAEQGGADGVSAINTLVGMGIDPMTGKFRISNRFGGLSGPAIKPVAVANVYKVAQAVKIPVVGIGGISNAGDVIEFIRAGAAAVQVGTANFRDPAIGQRIIADLDGLLAEIGVGNLQQLRGQAE